MTPEGPPPTRRSLRDGRDRAFEADPPVEGDPSALPLLVAAVAIAESAAPGADHAASAGPRPVRGVPAASSRPDAGDAAHAASAPSVPVVLPPVALSWVDDGTVAAHAVPMRQLTATVSTFPPVAADLLARAPRRSPWRPGVLIPAGLIAGLVAVYCLTVLLWPLHAVAPTVTALAVRAAPAAEAQPAWPAVGSASVGVDGVGAVAASTLDAASIASITKVVTALVVLEQLPLAPGEQGRAFQFTAADSSAYWRYLANDESALDVPVGGSLTEYQLLQGMLIGSAGNYADRLATTIWPTDALYASAANGWLRDHGITGITVVEPTGIDHGNTASPAALLALGAVAMANPVIAEIVRTASVELPGAGLVENTNALLADAGVVGIKTGTLEGYNLLAAKDVAVGGTTVRIYAAVLDQPDHEARDAAMRALFARTEQELTPLPAVSAGTPVAQVETRWADPVAVVAAEDASVVLWNGATAATSQTVELGDAREAGAVVGTLTVRGPKDVAQVDAVLAEEVPAPSPWWRLTHPLELFGLL